MPATKAVATRQAQLDMKALEALATIGGARTRDEDILFEGTKFIFPEQFRGDLDGMKGFVDRYVKSQQEMVVVSKTFDYRPYDGAHATYQMLKEHFGYAQSTAKKGLFGPEPPREITIPIGFVNGKLQQVTVPWGNMILPIVGATLMMDISHDRAKGDLFVLNTQCRKVHKPIIDGFYKVVQHYLETNSIYRGHAVNGAMEFFDVDQVDPSQFVYSEQVWADAETHIFSPMKDAKVLASMGLDPKRVVLLEGPFGTGKSGLGRTAAKVAVANGWTALFCRPGVDNPFAGMQTASLYLPIEDKGGCLVFMEDIDTISANLQDPTYTSRLLDTFDGFETKGRPFVLVMTTNHAEEITQGMTRPGRIHGIITIGAMDEPGVERLSNVVIGQRLAPDIDWHAVYESTEGYMPAFVREGIERSLRYSIARTGEVGMITTTDLVHAMGSLRGQFNLHMAANDRPDRLPGLDRMFRQAIKEESAALKSEDVSEIVDDRIESRLHGAVITDPDTGRPIYNLNTN
jgi:hypothetical protein